jgi:molybdopterin-guanine dinucleotide biosynthesis protein A
MGMLSGIILAGGESLRMGGDNKALLMFGEEALIQRQIRIMKTICSEIIIVTNTPKQFLRKVDESVRIITDYIPNKGPLSGMHAGLTLSRNKNAWVVGCDMPFLSPVAATMMLEQKKEGIDAIFPWIQGAVHPLHGIFDRDCAYDIWTLLMNHQLELDSLCQVLVWQEFVEKEFHAAGVGSEFVTTIKTMEDYWDAAVMTEAAR